MEIGRVIFLTYPYIRWFGKFRNPLGKEGYDIFTRLHRFQKIHPVYPPKFPETSFFREIFYLFSFSREIPSPRKSFRFLSITFFPLHR